MTGWLLHTVWPQALHAAIYTLSGGLVTMLILTPFHSAVRKVWRAVDSLDPHTDTGVTKQLREIRNREQPTIVAVKPRKVGQ